MWPMHQESLMLLHPMVREKMHLQENTLFVLDLGVKSEIMYFLVQVNLAISKSRGMAKILRVIWSSTWAKCDVTPCDVHVQFLQDILLQYMCSQTVPTENRIEMETKEINFSLFYFHFNYVVDRHNATALARDKQYCGNGEFFFF